MAFRTVDGGRLVRRRLAGQPPDVGRRHERDDDDRDDVDHRGNDHTTPVAERNDSVVSGQRIDFPVKFPGANCVGDGTLATMPDPASATALLVLDDGSERIVPVFDVEHLARKLYLEDCERQTIESLVAIELIDLHAVECKGRPVTEGALRLTRRASTAAVSVQSVSNNILFGFEAPDAPVDGPVVALSQEVDVASAPVRFVESRCDPHAIHRDWGDG